jgi:hypothetical protein
VPTVSDFIINSTVNHPISRVVYNPADAYSVLINTQNTIFYNEPLTVNYSGSNLRSTDSDKVPVFSAMFVLNKISPRYMIPGKIESENYSLMSGIQTEVTTDVGGGLDVGYTNAGDYMKYPVFVQTAGNFDLTYRMAGNGGKASLFYDDATNASFVGSVTFPATGGWQNWQDIKLPVALTSGAHTLKVTVDVEGFNLNYMNFTLNTSALHSQFDDAGFGMYPNPANDEFSLVYTCENKSVRMDILNLQGSIVLTDHFTDRVHISNNYMVGNLQKGIFLVRIIDGGKLLTRKLVIK